MSRPTPTGEAAPPAVLRSPEALRRAALARASQRAAPIARRRIAWRWAAFVLRRALLWGFVPAAVLLTLWWKNGARWP